MEEMTRNNKVLVSGTVVSNPEYNHEVGGETFYKMVIATKRKSGVEDKIPVLLSGSLLDADADYEGQKVTIVGQYRSRNMEQDGKMRVILNVLAKKFYTDQQGENVADKNKISLIGFICKQPVYRTTPGGREVCNITLAVNRTNGQTAYIPCVFWGRGARHLANRQVGEQVQVEGRIQSREYEKESKIRTAYEVSVSGFQMVREKEVEPSFAMN